MNTLNDVYYYYFQTISPKISKSVILIVGFFGEK
jgi:hypothetical protein